MSGGTIQEVMIVGAGSVGGFFGASLARRHPAVSFVLRPRTLDAVRRHGLTIRSAAGTFTVHPRAAADPRDLPPPDLIILATKAYDLDEALERIAPVVTDRTVLLTVQNGVDAEDRVIARFQRDCVVGGVAFIYAKIVEPGVIEHYKRGALAIGELMGQRTPRVVRIAELFEGAGVPCQISEDIRRSKWEKMCWNCVFNPLTVMLDDRVAKALDQPDMDRVISHIVQEVVMVAAGQKIALPEDMAGKVVQWSQELRDIHTSMYDDWKAGRPTEIDSLNGYIIARSRELGLPAPVNETLTVIIKTLTQRERAGPGILRIEGAVIQPLSFDRKALAALSEEHQVPDVSTLVPGMGGRGIRVRGLLQVPAVAVDADHVTFHSADGRFAASLTLHDAMEHGILVYEADGAPLTDPHGGPFRLVMPGFGDLCANVKGVTRIELTKGPGKDTRPSVKKH